jgi:glucan 1,4-alpha-maltotetraohydrolase
MVGLREFHDFFGKTSKEYRLKYVESLLSAVAMAMLSHAVNADVSGKAMNTSLRYHGGDEIILQGFQWNSWRMHPNAWYDKVNGVVAPVPGGLSITDLGPTMIWMPPPFRDHSSWTDSSGFVWGGEGYFWHDWNLNSKYGSETSLKNLTNKLASNNIKVIFDMVPNHRNYKIPNETEKAYPYPGQQWRQGGSDSGDPFLGGDADLNTENQTVYGDFKAAMQNLVANFNASGFRFDFARGYSSATTNNWMKDTKDDGFCVGEVWVDPITQNQHETWSSGANCPVYDFVLKQKINTGDVTQFMFGLNANAVTTWRERAVTFVDNHDTGYSPGQSGGQHHWPAPDAIREKAYAYILTSPGTPSIYWSDAFDWGRYTMLKDLIAARKKADVRASSDIKFCMTNAPAGQQCAKGNGSWGGGLVYVVNSSNTWGGRKLVGALGTGLPDPNVVADGTYEIAAAGQWGVIYVEKTNITNPPAVDVVAPSKPGAPVVTALLSTSVKAKWSASTDNVGVSRYDLLVGSKKTTVPGNITTAMVDGLSGATAYGVAVYAYDAAGNRSLLSDKVKVTTPEKIANNTVTIHYKRHNNDYSGWTLHLWEKSHSARDKPWETLWSSGRRFDVYGSCGWGQTISTTFAIESLTTEIGFIVHNGNTKDVVVDRFLVPASAREIWLRQGDPTIYTSRP